jgi:hypothetical protein
MTFAKRIINLQFTLGQGDFGTAGQDTVTLEGLRCSVEIAQAGLQMAQLDLRVWGMKLEQMNKLTVLNKLAYDEVYQNTVTVMAGDSESGVAVCFQGIIQEAWADGRQPAEMVFQVLAFSGLYERTKPIPPTSYNGSVDVATVISGIAAQMGMGFENSGVTGQIANPYLPGDLGRQLERICAAADCNYTIDDVAQVVAVWPKGKARNGESVLISPDTGLIGYPAFTQNGIQLTTLYNPSLVFGRSVNIESAITPAGGSWSIAAVSHVLESEMPGGAWDTSIECGYLGAL